MEGPSNECIFGTIVKHGVAGAPIKFVAMGGENGQLFPWCEHMSMREFPYSLNNVTNHLMISLLEATKECICLGGSSSVVKKLSLQELALSLQFLLVEASIVCLGIKKSISGAEVSKKKLDDSYQNTLRTLERAHELYPKLKEENLDLRGKNKDLAKRLVVAEGMAEKLSRKVAPERAGKEIMDVAMKKMAKEHHATVNKMAEE